MQVVEHKLQIIILCKLVSNEINFYHLYNNRKPSNSMDRIFSILKQKRMGAQLFQLQLLFQYPCTGRRLLYADLARFHGPALPYGAGGAT